MKPPSFWVFVLGHPIVMLMTTGCATYLGWLCYLNTVGGTMIMAGAAFLLATRSMKDFDHRRRYRMWRRDCMEIAGIATTRRPVGKWFLLGLFVFIVSWMAYLHRNDVPMWLLADGQILLAMTALLLMFVVTVRTVCRLLRCRKRSKPRTVTLATAKPPASPSSLKNAYRALPDYCQDLLKDRS